MSNKNPFEIRLEILNMAKSYLEGQYYTNLEFAKNSYEKAIELGKTAQEAWKECIPPMFGVNEILEKANEMYSFICASGRTEEKDTSKK